MHFTSQNFEIPKVSLELTHDAEAVSPIDPFICGLILFKK